MASWCALPVVLRAPTASSTTSADFNRRTQRRSWDATGIPLSLCLCRVMSLSWFFLTVLEPAHFMLSNDLGWYSFMFFSHFLLFFGGGVMDQHTPSQPSPEIQRPVNPMTLRCSATPHISQPGSLQLCRILWSLWPWNSWCDIWQSWSSRNRTAAGHILPSGQLSRQKALENGHWNRESSHQTWWFSVVMLNYQRVISTVLGLRSNG